MKTKKRHDEPLGYTVAGILAKAGGRAAVARLCGVSIQSVGKWGKRIPDKHAHAIAVAAGLPLEIVRPDLVAAGHEIAVKLMREQK